MVPETVSVLEEKAQRLVDAQLAKRPEDVQGELFTELVEAGESNAALFGRSQSR